MPKPKKETKIPRGDSITIRCKREDKEEFNKICGQLEQETGKKTKEYEVLGMLIRKASQIPNFISTLQK